MALTSFSRDLFSPAEEFFGTTLFRPFEGSFAARELAVPRAMPVDVVEHDDNFAVKADVPGVNKEDINVSVDNNILSIKVNKEQEKKEEGATWHRYERQQTFVQRSLRMPESADLDNVTAKYENGVLSLNVLKKKVPKGDEKKKIAVK